jgi:hypothetical protein
MTLVKLRFAVLLLICALVSCAIPPRPVSIPTIQPTTEWRMEERCGYEGCYPLVDFLIGKGIEARIEAENHKFDKSIFTMVVTFATPENVCYRYTRSLSYVTLSDGRSVRAEDLGCNDNMARVYANLKEPFQLQGPVHKRQRYDCFRLYFGIPAPSTQEPFTLQLRGLETCNGSPVDFPDLHFSGGMRQ